jgi:hypothetical protein
MADLYNAWPPLQRYIASARNRVYSVTGVKDADRCIDGLCVVQAGSMATDTGVSTLQISHDDDRNLEFGLNVPRSLMRRIVARHVMTRRSCSP